MLFNSPEFLLLFLPLTVLGFYALGRFGRGPLVLLWLIAASLAFHAYWKASYTWLFLASVLANHVLGRLCRPPEGAPAARPVFRKVILVLGLAVDIGVLGYFKYAGFFAGVAESLTGIGVHVGEIVLPLAISFYTFQQIAFLVDTYRGNCPRYSLLQYGSYLAFFPHLIAGPIVRHDSLVRQLSQRRIAVPRAENLLSGLAIMTIGLFKKVVLADGAAGYADPVFAAVAGGTPIGAADAWMAAIQFSFVIYFDFSGYSDMAIGLARMFNVRFPENFASPYQAANIIEFWRRWHMTLSAFLRSYLYIPLGGNRHGLARHGMNIMITMALGGLWHGASWNFVIWGLVHGAYLLIAHVWRSRQYRREDATSISGAFLARALTYAAVVVAWVPFRTTTFAETERFLESMVGLHGAAAHVAVPPGLFGDSHLGQLLFCAALLLVVNFLPNTQAFMRLYRPVHARAKIRMHHLMRRLVWRLDMTGVSFIAALGCVAMAQMEHVQTFIYFRF